MTPSSRAAALLLSLLLPVTVLASSGDTRIMDDLDAFAASRLWLLAEEESQADEAALDEQAELLPLSAESEREMRHTIAAGSGITVGIDGLNVTFADVERTAWYAPYVLSAVEQGAISGYRDEEGRLLGLFGPADSVTVEQLAKMALESSGFTLEACARLAGTAAVLNVTAAGRWSEDYVRCAEARGLALYSDGSVVVTRPALRNEVVVTLLQAFGVSATPATGTVFDDVTTAVQFAGFIEKAAADNVVSGYSDADGTPTGRFGPADPVDRAAMAKILVTAHDHYAK